MAWAIAAILTGSAVVILVVVLATRHNRRKELETAGHLRAMATDRGLVYEDEADKAFRKAWSVLPELPNSGAVHHLMYGEVDGLPVTLFRHRYVVHTGQTTAVIIHWVVSTDVPDWPELHIRKRNAIARALGVRSGVCDDRDFDRRWAIKSKNAALARALLKPEVVRLLDLAPAGASDLRKPLRGWHVVQGKLCAVFRGALDADDIAAAIDRLGDVRAAIPGELEGA